MAAQLQAFALGVREVFAIVVPGDGEKVEAPEIAQLIIGRLGESHAPRDQTAARSADSMGTRSASSSIA